MGVFARFNSDTSSCRLYSLGVLGSVQRIHHVSSGQRALTCNELIQHRWLCIISWYHQSYHDVGSIVTPLVAPPVAPSVGVTTCTTFCTLALYTVVDHGAIQ